MFRGKKYKDSAKQIDRGTLYIPRRVWNWFAKPHPPSSTKPSSCT